jgi:hypothetical protein
MARMGMARWQNASRTFFEDGFSMRRFWRMFRFPKTICVFLTGLLSATGALAELSYEQKNRLRGEMREQWSKITPQEKEQLRREHDEDQREEQREGRDGQRMQKVSLDNRTPPVDHHHLRRQLKEIAPDDKR